MKVNIYERENMYGQTIPTFDPGNSREAVGAIDLTDDFELCDTDFGKVLIQHADWGDHEVLPERDGDEWRLVYEGVSETSPSRYARQARYNKRNTTQVVMRLNKRTESDIIDRLQSRSNKQGYIKRLIRDDAAREGRRDAEALRQAASLIDAKFERTGLPYRVVCTILDGEVTEFGIKELGNELGYHGLDLRDGSTTDPVEWLRITADALAWARGIAW